MIFSDLRLPKTRPTCGRRGLQTRSSAGARVRLACTNTGKRLCSLSADKGERQSGENLEAGNDGSISKASIQWERSTVTRPHGSGRRARSRGALKPFIHRILFIFRLLPFCWAQQHGTNGPKTPFPVSRADRKRAASRSREQIRNGVRHTRSATDGFSPLFTGALHVKQHEWALCSCRKHARHYSFFSPLSVLIDADVRHGAYHFVAGICAELHTTDVRDFFVTWFSRKARRL